MPDRLGRRAIIMAGLVIVAIVAILLFLSQCEKRRSEGAQSRVDSSQSGAQSASGKDAIATQGQAGERDRVSEEVTRENSRAIHNAQGAGDKVNPNVDRAGRSALCRREAYRNLTECKGTK